MTDNAPSIDLTFVAVTLLIAGLYFLTCYAVGRYWRLNRGRNLTTGWMVSFFGTPVVGLVVGRLLEPGSTERPEPQVTSLHDAFQETYRDVDEKLHAHT